MQIGPPDWNRHGQEINVGVVQIALELEIPQNRVVVKKEPNLKWWSRY
jgi:hypothetical protein